MLNLIIDACSFYGNNVGITASVKPNNVLAVGGVISVADNVSVSALHSNFSSNRAKLSAGAIFLWNNSTLNVLFCKFDSNSADLGGAIAAHNIKFLYVEKCTFVNNLGDIGGALEVLRSSDIQVVYSVFSGNTALRDGGSIICIECEVYIDNCFFVANSGNFGGAVRAFSNSNMQARNSVFSGNAAVKAGGAFFCSQCEAYIDNCTFVANSGNAGGAIHMFESSTIQARNSVFRGNTAPKAGGALFCLNCVAYIGACTFVENSGDIAGSFFVTGNSKLQVNNAVFRNNTARNIGGAMVFSDRMTAFISNCVFENNSAYKSGSIHIIESVSIQLRNVTFLYNTGNINTWSSLLTIFRSYLDLGNIPLTFPKEIYGYGGGVLTAKDNCNLIVDSCQFVKNKATYAAVAGLSDNVTVTIINSSFVRNVAGVIGVFAADNSVRINISNSYFQENQAALISIGLVRSGSKITLLNVDIYEQSIDLWHKTNFVIMFKSMLTMSNSVTGNFMSYKAIYLSV